MKEIDRSLLENDRLLLHCYQKDKAFVIRNRIKIERAKRDLTQADLAVLAGVTRRSINAIETGRMMPSVLVALKIAQALGVTLETIFTLERS